MKVTKKQLTERCRAILYSDPEVTGDDFDFMMQILNMHTEADKKIGCGVKRIWSAPNPVYTHTRNFYIERFDGSTTDFSFTHCISPADDFKSACRNAVHYQIKAFREANNMDRTRHADHHPESFDSILARFVVIHGKGKTTINDDNSFGCFLADKEYEKKWQEFHQAEAILRDIPAIDNLKKSRK